MAGSGSGFECEECIELASQLGTRVTPHGYVNHRQLAELKKQAYIQGHGEEYSVRLSLSN